MDSLFSFLIIITSYILYAVTSIQAQGLSRHSRFHGGLTRQEIRALNLSDYPPLGIQIPVDHFNTSDSRTYNNRYWINVTHYKRSGPVFFYDVGEADAHPTAAQMLRDSERSPDAVMELARRFDGMAVVFEHRFYGKSLPMPLNATSDCQFDNNAHQYLTTEQALEDVVYFSNNFQPPSEKKSWSSLSPANTPWIWVGGSYPGIRGAIMRIRNPEVIFATWASSAPTEHRIDFWQYFAQAERTMTRNCSADYTHVVNWVDQVLTNGTKGEVLRLKTQLSNTMTPNLYGRLLGKVTLSEFELPENAMIALYLAAPLHDFQYTGPRGLQPFCDT
ncbi:hypothetical protein E4T47_04647 [Aureobasidium subglaciale]|nr:hypothetical protein E4T47_04647 [Aureobasidium subglaciale]